MGAGVIFDWSVRTRKPFECSYEDWPKPELVRPTVDVIFQNGDNINIIFVPVSRALRIFNQFYDISILIFLLKIKLSKKKKCINRFKVQANWVLVQLEWNRLFFLNDWQLISPFNLNTKSMIQVMTIRNFISSSMLSLYTTKFSDLKLNEIYGNLCGEFIVGSSLG